MSRSSSKERARLARSTPPRQGRVSLIPTAERGFALAVALDVSLPDVSDADQAAKLVAAAHSVCPYSNATRGNIEVKLTAHGQPVS